MAKLKSEHEHWLADEITLSRKTLNLEGSDIKETINLVNQAEECERTRRMSIPFSADVEETELDISVQSGQLSNVHQELLHLFAIHDVSCVDKILCFSYFPPKFCSVKTKIKPVAAGFERGDGVRGVASERRGASLYEYSGVSLS